MKRLVAFASVLLAAMPGVAGADRPKTYFDYVERAWACAEVELRSPMTYRDGFVLAYPGTLTDVVHARQGRPQSILLVEELTSKDDKSPVKEGERFFAPLQVLPDHSYWRDNLPSTPRHGVLGGRRYIFAGDDLAPAKDLTKAYAATLALDMPERRTRQQALIVDTLSSPVKVLREDALRRLVTVPVPAKHYDDKTIRRLVEYAKGKADGADRASAVQVMGQAGMTTAIPDLQLLAQTDDVVGASALDALEALGQRRPTDGLIPLLDAKTPEVRAFAGRELGELGSKDAAAFARVGALLASDDLPAVRSAAEKGLGASEDPATLDVLNKALLRADGASRDAAAAMASIGGERAATLLKSAIVDGEGEAQVSAVMALVNVKGKCPDCPAFLREQKESHPEAAVRDLISVLLELNVKHDH
jgi:HEAT repeat protein